MSIGRMSCWIFLIVFSVFLDKAMAQGVEKAKSEKNLEQTVVFVCEHGAAKSIVAAAWFNKLAREKNMKYRAVARGTSPQEEIAPSAAKGLQADTLQPTEFKPKELSKEDLSGSVRVVTFCKLPEADYRTTTIEEWMDVPAVGEDYIKARDAIVSHLKNLLVTLETRK